MAKRQRQETRPEAKPMAEPKMADPRPPAPKAPVPRQPEIKVSKMALTPDQAKEFHEQFKVTYSAFVGLAAVAHLLVFASKPWF
jgi:light-harvesting complex 1 beta chain